MLVSSVLGGRSRILLLVACWGFPCLTVRRTAGLHPRSLGTLCGAWSRVCRGQALLFPLTELRELGPYLLLSKYQFHFPPPTN